MRWGIFLLLHESSMAESESFNSIYFKFDNFFNPLNIISIFVCLSGFPYKSILRSWVYSNSCKVFPKTFDSFEDIPPYANYI